MSIRKNTFLIKRSNVPGKIPNPGDLQLGELAINTSDVILYASGTTSNSILPIGWDRVSKTGDTMTGTLYVPTISATTYQNLPIDVYVTGGTYNSGTATFTNNTGGTFSVTGFTTGGTGSDTYVTGFTYSSNTFTIKQNNGQSDLSVVANTMTGLTVNGDVSISGSSLPGGYALSVTGDTNFVGDVYVTGDLTYNGDLLVTGGTIIQSGLTANTIYTDYIDFNTGYTGNVLPARLQWDDGNGTLVLGLKGGVSDIEIGLENMALCYNAEATTLSAGTIVYVSGSQGNRPSIKRAIAISDGYSVTTLGMVSEPIASGAEGFVTTFGMVNKLNTIGLSGGTAIWLSPTVAGEYTTIKPQAPQHTVLIGYVVRVSATVGSVFIHISNGWEIDELHDVRITGKTYGDLLTLSAYNGTDVWVNSKTLNGSYTITGNTTIGGNLTSTTISATTYQNLPTDIRVTGATYSNNTFTYTNNTGGTFNVLFNTMTGLTVNGNLNVTGGTQSIFSGNSSTELVRITQTGSGDAFVVEDSTNVDNSHFVINASGDTAIGLTQPIGGDKLTVSGNTTVYGTLKGVTISATTYQNLPNNGLRVIPMATANTTLATASNDYYMNVRCPYNLVANKVLCLFSTTGADQVRVGIYRGQDLTATLVGQGVIAGGAVTTISEFTITAVSGQTLSFSGGEWMVIAMAIGGTTTSPQSSTTIANNSLSWNNTTDSASTGFPTNPRSKGGTNTSFPSFEIYP